MTQNLTKKPYTSPQLVEYGDLGTLIRANPAGMGMNDGVAMKKGQFKTG